MSHDITATDNLVLHKRPAWHGLGEIVPDALTAVQAQQKVLAWEVDQMPLYATDGEKRVVCHGYQANVRRDTGAVLGVVKAGWKPVQNWELAEFCDALAEQGDTVKIESCGSIQGGKKLWFLLQAGSFSVHGKDQVSDYLCISNGFDGFTSIRCKFTSVRVVCRNTLGMVIPMQGERERNRTGLKEAFISFKHVGDVRKKIEQAKQALGLYRKASEETHKVIDVLAAQDVNSDKMREFFLRCYTRDFGVIPLEPVDAKEERRLEKAMDAFTFVQRRFEEEKNIAGTTLWCVLNAYTGYLQHDRKQGKDAAWTRLMGLDDERARLSLETALSMAV